MADLWKLPGVRPRKPHRATRPQLLTRDQLDHRTDAAKAFDRLASDLWADMGGRDPLSTIELALEAFCGAAVTLDNLNTRLLLGEKIDLAQHAQAVSAMVRVARPYEYPHRAQRARLHRADHRLKKRKQ